MQNQNPFSGLSDMLSFLEKNPKEADNRFRQLARMGIDPPPFSTPEEFINVFNQSQQTSAQRSPEQNFSPGTSVPQMPGPADLNMLLMGRMPGG